MLTLRAGRSRSLVGAPVGAAGAAVAVDAAVSTVDDWVLGIGFSWRWGGIAAGGGALVVEIG